MPWINREMCTGCQMCIDLCCVGAIHMAEDVAFIQDEECIRCGVCHDICPTDAIRHDSERIPEEVQANLAWAGELLKHPYYSGDREGQRQLVKRLQRHFAKNKEVMARTLDQLEILEHTEYAV